VGENSRALIESLHIFARQDETILISGPSGSGKSRLAELSHTISPRRAGPFQIVDLLSIPEDMQMAELFGWKRGAFTGAVRDQDGCVARSDGGTLFIDEIDKLSLRTQAGLLQFMEMRKYRLLGDPGHLRAANVRFIVATNADLRAQVARGLFREDLYFRISVLPVRVLPLSERRDEIAPWARYMLARRHREAGLEGRVILCGEAEQALVSAAWPGNLRQLDNVVRRTYALALAERGDGQDGEPTVALRHVERALAYEGAVEPQPRLMASLRRAADDFIEQALLRQTEGQALDIDHIGALGGLVLEAGVRRLGDLRQVFCLLGGAAVVKSRNHNREFRRELAKVARLEASLSRVSSAAGSYAGPAGEPRSAA